MGPLVVTSGRITLPEPLEGQALTVLEFELGGRQGPFDPDRLTVGATPVETFADLASLAGVTVLREGEELLFSTDHAGDPRWSEQAAAFWSGLGRFATGGEIHLRGADGTTWSYRYSPDGVQVVGAPPVGPEPTTALPRRDPEPPPAPAPEPVPPPEPAQGPPATGGWPPPVPPPVPPPDASENPYAALFDDSEPPPRSSGRTAAMAALLVVGVLLIVGVAMLTAGLL